MRKRSLWEWICISGMPWFPIITWLLVSLKRLWFEVTGHYQYVIDTRPALGIAVMAVFIIFLKNIMWMDTPRKIRLMTWTQKYDFEPQNISYRKYIAQHPPIGEEFLSNTPDGLVLGKKGNKFVRVKMTKTNILNAIIVGAPGWQQYRDGT